MDMKYYVLDRIEGETAILLSDGGDAHELPAASLPCGAAEGDVLICGREGLWVIDRGETDRRRAAADGRLSRLLNKKGPKGR